MKPLYPFLFVFFSLQNISAQGNALDFDGSDDRVVIPSSASINFTNNFTIEAWVKPINLNDRNAWVSKANSDNSGSQYRAGYSWIGTNEWGFAYRESSCTGNNCWHNYYSGSVLPLGTWSHVAITVSATEIKLYLDGSNIKTFSGLSVNLPAGGNPAYIGYQKDDNFWFGGMIDEVRIWSGVRTATEISDNKDIEIDCATSGLAACYHFNQGTAGGNNSGETTLNDGTGTNNGSLENFTLNGSNSNWVTSGAPLPVEMTSFKARSLNSTTMLTWQTATEFNNRGWEIQQSNDGINWKNIGWQGGHGTTLVEQDYRFTDYDPYIGENYYRLKQIDYDGRTEFSNIVSVHFKNHDNDINIFPNPATSAIFIKSTNQNPIGNISLYNQIGQQIKHLKLSGDIFGISQIDISDLPKGIYLLIIKSGIKEVREKIVVE